MKLHHFGILASLLKDRFTQSHNDAALSAADFTRMQALRWPQQNASPVSKAGGCPSLRSSDPRLLDFSPAT